MDGLSASEALIAEYAATKAQIERLQTELAAITEDLVGYMQAKGRKTLRSSQNGYLLQATYTQQTTVKVDEKGLRKRLGAKTFDLYTVRKLDRQRLEQAMEAGEVDSVEVAPFVEATKSKPFIKFTIKEDSSEPDDGA